MSVYIYIYIYIYISSWYKNFTYASLIFIIITPQYSISMSQVRTNLVSEVNINKKEIDFIPPNKSNNLDL